MSVRLQCIAYKWVRDKEKERPLVRATGPEVNKHFSAVTKCVFPISSARLKKKCVHSVERIRFVMEYGSSLDTEDDQILP